MQSPTPPFLFDIWTMRQRRDILDSALVDQNGQWHPPRRRGDNRRVTRDVNGSTFTCDGQNIVRDWPHAPAADDHYKTYSIYVCDDRFRIVDFDATQNQVGDGRNVNDVASNSDSDSGDTDDTATDYDRPENRMDWKPLKFIHTGAEGDYTSFATWRLTPESRLRTQRQDQVWAFRVLPEAYHAQHPAWTDVEQYGGLNGELPLLLGLIAFAVDNRHVRRAFPACFVNGQWDLDMLDQFTPPHGRIDRRGLVISVYTWPEYSDAATLESYENGEYGKIFD